MTIQLSGPNLELGLRRIFTFALSSNVDFTFEIQPGAIILDGTPEVLTSLQSTLPESITVSEVPT